MIDDLLASLVAASKEAEPRLAVKEVLERAVSQPGELARALPPSRAGLTRLHVTDDLTVLHLVWAPDMYLKPHDHRMWAAIGLYTGGEDNSFYRRGSEGGLVESGGRSLRAGDVTLLGDDAIHAVHNPTAEFTGAIHVYGGQFFTTPRSEWDRETFEERPFDAAGLTDFFEEQNQAFGV